MLRLVQPGSQEGSGLDGGVVEEPPLTDIGSVDISGMHPSVREIRDLYFGVDGVERTGLGHGNHTLYRTQVLVHPITLSHGPKKMTEVIC